MGSWAYFCWGVTSLGVAAVDRSEAAASEGWRGAESSGVATAAVVNLAFCKNRREVGRCCKRRPCVTVDHSSCKPRSLYLRLLGQACGRP